MKQTILIVCTLLIGFSSWSQDSTQNDVFDASAYTDATNDKKFCTQKVINQTPTRFAGIAYEHNFGFKNNKTKNATEPDDRINSMGGLRANVSFLAISSNKFILSVGGSYWGSRVHTDQYRTGNLGQIYNNTMHIGGLNLLAFKPLNEKHFIIAQGNVDASHIGNKNWELTSESLTYYGSILFGWKKGDYKMLALGVSRTYRLGRPLIVPIILWNRTFTEHWGIEALLPARAHLRYNFSPNSMLLAGYELEGQQFDLNTNSDFLQRGEIKPRLMLEQKLVGAFWLSAQLGARLNGRFDLVDRYNGNEDQITESYTWKTAQYFQVGINFVSP